MVRPSKKLSKLTRVSVTRHEKLKGSNADSVDVFGVDSPDKLFEALDVRERDIREGRWQSKTSGR